VSAGIITVIGSCYLGGYIYNQGYPIGVIPVLVFSVRVYDEGFIDLYNKLYKMNYTHIKRLDHSFGLVITLYSTVTTSYPPTNSPSTVPGSPKIR
jgi:hypothetical protein